MGRVAKPLALVLMPDVPEEAVQLLVELGHHVYVFPVMPPTIDAVVGSKCWRMPSEWWVRDGVLAPTAQVMLKAVTAQAYPVAKAKKGKRK